MQKIAISLQDAQKTSAHSSFGAIEFALREYAQGIGQEQPLGCSLEMFALVSGELGKKTCFCKSSFKFVEHLFGIGAHFVEMIA